MNDIERFKLEVTKPVPIEMQMRQEGFDAITDMLQETDKEKYKTEHNIKIIDEKKSLLRKHQALVIFSDGHKKIIELFEEK